MNNVVKNIYELIGQTPVYQFPTSADMADIFVKLEWFNPGGSIKDRISLSMIQDAISQGKLKPGDTIVEPTSGNTGVGVAMIAAQMGFKSVIIMPESVSVERIKILKAYGAEVILTPKDESMEGSIAIADKLEQEKGYVQLKQFDNPANPKAHYETTALEILSQVPTITHFVIGSGTGGTLSGAGRRLKEDNGVKLIAVEPETSAVMQGKPSLGHKIQGIGPGFVPRIVDVSLFDELRTIKDSEAIEMARTLAKDYGLLGGFSTGCNIAASIKLAKELGPGYTIVTVSASNGERYLSTTLFEEKDA